MAALLDWSVFQTGGTSTVSDGASGEDADVTVTTSGMTFFADGSGTYGTTGFVYGSGGTTANPNTTSVDFGENVQNASFELLDVDGGDTWSDAVTIDARDADGNPVAVIFSSVDPALQTVTDNGDGTYTVSASGAASNSFDGSGSADSVIVQFAGPVATIGISFENGPSNANSGTVGINDISFDIVCFTPGTLIATPLGDKLIEDLKVGDLVITKDSGIQAIRWIGRKKVSGARLQSFTHLRPILIRKDAFGPDLPNKDMHVSPQHRILVSGQNVMMNFAESQVLAPAKGLITDQSVIVDSSVKGVEYIHVLFDKHEVIYSDGLPTESFHPGDLSLSGLDDDTRNEVFDIFPELRSDFGAYGQAARLSLSVSESACLR